MGNYIKTKNGIDISLDIPAQITSFETDVNENGNSHVTRGKLKVFFIGKTGDIRVFTKQFSENLILSLPGTPVVAFYDDETDDFLGHNSEQYVYGYVPEDAVPEFVEEDGKTWAVVDINLFTERKDKIGEVAKKIIGKAQSLELNPDTVDWELVYINNRLEKIVFKQGSFYGLSVLGDNQQPAFDGAGFFTTNVIDELKHFHKTSNNDGGNLEMNKTDFLSLGVCDKRRKFDEIITSKNLFDAFYVIDFTEEQVIIEACKEVEDWTVKYYAANYTWNGQDSYEIGEFFEVIPSYVKKEENSSDPSTFEKKEEEESGSTDTEEEIALASEETPAPTSEGETSSDAETPAEGDGETPSGDASVAEELPVQEEEEKEEEENCSKCGDDDEEKSHCEELEEKPEEPEERDSDEQEDRQEEDEEEKKDDNKEVASNASTLSDEERNELNELRREKKMALVNQYTEYLSSDAIEKIKSEIDTYEISDLERELKVQSFDANKNKFQEKEDSTFGIVLPSIPAKEYSNALDRLVAENI